LTSFACSEEAVVVCRTADVNVIVTYAFVLPDFRIGKVASIDEEKE
jgi:hypothetical protein